MNENLVRAIQDNVFDHYKFLQDLPEFPRACLVSSHTFASFFGNLYPMKLVYGTFGSDYGIHCWIEVGERWVIDFTLFQFLIPLDDAFVYQQEDTERLIELITKWQGGFLIEKTPDLQMMYHPLCEVKPFFMDMAKTFTHYDYFTEEVFVFLDSPASQGFSWDTTITATGETFISKMKQDGLRYANRSGLLTILPA